jgi:hypothetical protein
MLRKITVGMDRKTVAQLTGGDPLPRIAGSMPDGTVLRIDEVGLFEPGTYTFYWIGGILTGTIIWWFNPANMPIFGTTYWFQYQNDLLARWGQRDDFLPNVKGDIVIRQNPNSDTAPKENSTIPEK